MMFNEFISNVSAFDSSAFDYVNELTSAKETKVYSFNVIKGEVTKKVFNLAFPKVNKEAFQLAFIRIWYNREATKAANEAEAFKKGEGDEEAKEAESKLSSEELLKLEEAEKVVSANEANLSSALEALKAVNLHSQPFTIRLLVSAIRKETPSDEVKEYFSSVDKLVKKSKESIRKEKNPFVNLKPFKEELQKVTTSLWIADEGIIEKYTFNANSRLAIEVLQVVYKGLKFNGKGELKRVYSSEAELIREVVYQMFKQLLEKEAAKDEAKEAAKDEELAKASNPAK